jgi:D-glycero-D-manno-heptose 1,7-bisphosphate phosphatase
MRIRHIILDRDGVLNQESERLVAQPEHWRWVPGSLEALALLARAGVRVSVATNQGAIGRGQLTTRALDAIHDRMIREAQDAGATIHAVFVCPHAAEAACECRKPAPGLLRSAIKAARIPERETWMIGDDRRDMEAATAAGIEGVLVLTGKGTEVTRSRTLEHHDIYHDLRAVALALTLPARVTRCES